MDGSTVAQPETSTLSLDAYETHTGMVILVGDRAFKAKKPVRTDFLDFRKPEQRERACAREVELNRRLAPNSYLGVAHFSEPGGGSAEPIIVMRRYRDEDRLASLVKHGQSVESALDSIAGLLARFHDQSHHSRQISAQGSLAAIERRWHDNLAALRCHTGVVELELLQLIQDLAAYYMTGRAGLFQRRIEEPCIVDGHGDLLAEDIFWVDNWPVLLDCLEFSDELRHVDRIDDAAFLAMDLEFLGRKDLGDFFMGRYAAHSGDTAPQSLRSFYVAYRAVVRAKVDCIRLAQGKPEAAADADRHLAIALRHLEHGAVRLALVGGSPGTGKSTVARALAEQVGALVISSDDVRRELHEAGAVSGSAGLLNAGLYSPDNVAAVYEVMMGRARLCLSNGQSVILDGTWRDRGIRAQAHRVATEKHAAMVEVICLTTSNEAADRISNRPAGSSDATPEIAAALAQQDSGWDTAHRLDTSRPLEHSVQEVYDLWRRAIWPPQRADSHPGAGTRDATIPSNRE